MLKRKLFFFISTFVILWAGTMNETRACHIFGATDLAFTENPPGSGLYDVSFEYFAAPGESCFLYFEIHINEAGCPPSTCTDYMAASGCIDATTGLGFPGDGSQTETPVVGLPLCPGKGYDVVFLYRRSNVPGCLPGDERPDFILNGPGTSGTPFEPDCSIAGTCAWLGGTGDINWAYITATIPPAPGDIVWSLDVDIDFEDDCTMPTDLAYSNDQMANGGPTDAFVADPVQLRCGSEFTLSWVSDNACGNAGNPGNTFEISTAGTSANYVGFDASSTTAFMAECETGDPNNDGRFETDMFSDSGFACEPAGDIVLEFMNASCNSLANDVMVSVTQPVEILYPTSDFADPVRVNCSDMCGQELVLPGDEWNMGGIDMGGTTSIEEFIDDGVGGNALTLTWSGQICPPVAGAACDGQNSVLVDECAACGVYDITYEIVNSTCAGCSTTTTKQIEVVTPLIANECADLALACGDYTFTLAADVVECNPADGSPTATPYTGTGALVWSRDDGGADDDFLVVAPAPGSCTTVTFTPAWVSGGTCAACDAAGQPVTVSVCTPEDLELCTTDYATAIADWVAAQEALLNGAAAGVTDCDAPVVTNDYDGAPPPPCGEVVVNFTVTSGAMTSTCMATAAVNDEEPPMITCPPDVTGLDCNTDFAADYPGATDIATFEGLGGTVSDNCIPPLTISFADDIDPATFSFCDADAPFVVTRTYTVVDECMNENTCVQTFTFDPDITPPEITCPDPVTITCTDPFPAGVTAINAFLGLAGATAMDDCSAPEDLTVAFVDDIPYDACVSGPITRTYTIADECGNESTCTQIITVEGDETPPVLSAMPADATITCTDPIPPIESLMATDDCDDSPSIAFEETDDMGVCPDPRIITRTWTSVDACMNETVYTQTITIEPDTEDPVFDQPEPADIDLVCGDPFPAVPEITATDNCDDPIEVIFTEETVGTCPEPTVTTRTWTVEDACGNMVMYDQVITLPADGTPPTLSEEPADIILICTDPIPVPPNVTADDDCTTNIPVEFVETDDMGVCPDPRVITRTWTAEDACMNMVTYTQTITIEPDITPPTLSEMPADENLTCADPIPPAANVTATDDCTMPQEVVFVETDDGVCPADRVITRTWTATDDCGNETTYTQTITIAPDTTPPTLSDMPADLNLICTDAIPPADMITATDDCTDPVTVVLDEVDDMGVCPDPRIITRTWTATDDCMNETTYTQTITVAPDTTPPTLSDMPVDVDLVCGDPIPEVPNITATDDCTDPITVVFEETNMGTCPDPTVIMRTWTATDDCGNETTHTQVINIPPDDTAPVLSDMPADENLTCADVIPAAPTITATDDCIDPIDVVFEEIDDMGVCPDPRIITRTWTSTDACLNETTYTQTITVAPDTTPPTITCPPDDPTVYSLETDVPPPAADLAEFIAQGGTAADDCGMMTLTVEPVVTPCPGMANQGMVVYTYTIVDECMNETTCDQTFLFSCCDAAAGMLAPIANVCLGEEITTTVDGTEAPAPDYAYDYVLTDAAGMIIAGPQGNGTFTPSAAGDYCVYGVNYQVATGTPDYSSGDINTVTHPTDCIETTEACFTVGEAPMATIEACPNGPVPTDVLVGLEGTYPMDMLGILPDIYIFCEPGCLNGVGTGGTAPYTFEWFELSDECGYDFGAPIGNTQDMSGLGTGTYTVVVTDANGCTASYEAKVFVDTPPELTASDDACICPGECFDLEGTSTVGPGICLEYCEGELPMCIVDDNTIFTVCFEFDYTWISDLNLILQAPNGTQLVLVASAAFPNADMDGNLCFTNDPSLGGGVLPGGALDALDWNNYPSGTADAAGLGIGVSGNWFPMGGQGAFSTFNGVDANSGTWQVIILDDLPGFEGFFYNFTLDIVNPDCQYSADVDINQPIIDDVPTTIETEPIECEEYENCTATYQWTGDDGFDSGVLPLGDVDVTTETFPPLNVCPPTGSITTYTLTVMDCFGCVSTEEVIIEVPEEIMATAESPECEQLDITSITGGVADYTITIGMQPGATDALFTFGPTPDATTAPEFPNVLPAGDYFILITDSKGCAFELGPINVEPCFTCEDFMADINGCGMPIDSFIVEGNYPDGTLMDLPEVFVYCEGDLGCLDAVPVGGTAPYTYEWFELTDNCDYSDPAIGTDANLPDLQTGTYQVVITDANGCIGIFEAKIFIDEDPTINLNNGGDTEIWICKEGEFTINADALPGPDFCKEYCGGTLPQCPIDANSIITVCMEFDHTYISDLSFELVAPDGTIIPLVMGQCCPNGSNDGDQFCFTNDTSGGAVALDWNTTGSGGTDLLGIGTGISGTWLPETGAGAFGGLVGVDANSGPWAMIVTDIIGGDSGEFNFFEVTITGGTCETVFTSPNFDAPIPDNNESFTYETPVLECFNIENIISEYEWTCSDGTGTGVVPSTNNEIGGLPFIGTNPGTYTCTLEIWDLWGCSTTADFIINVPECVEAEYETTCNGLTVTPTGGYAGENGTDYTFTIDPDPNMTGAVNDPTVGTFDDLPCGDYTVTINDNTPVPPAGQTWADTPADGTINGQTCFDIPVSGYTTVLGLPNGAILDFACIDVTGLDVASLNVTLTSPAGTTITLMDLFGGQFGPDAEPCFQDGQPGIPIGTPPFGGVFSPFSGALSGFDGEDPNGNWTLCVSDVLGFGGFVLEEWSVIFTSEPCLATIDINIPCDPITAEAVSDPCETLDITTITGGNPDYTITVGFNMDASDALATATVTDASAMPEFTGLAPGDYYISIVDADGCEVVIGPITVESCNECDLEANVEPCSNGPAPTDVLMGLEGVYPDGTLGILPDIYVFCEPGCLSGVGMGGTMPYTYEWFELSMECGYDLNAPIATTQEVSGLMTGTYQVVVTDANGCTAIYEVKVFIDEPPTITASNDTIVCPNESFDLLGESLPGPGICLEYCEGEIPPCEITADATFTMCIDFSSGWVSDFGFELVFFPNDGSAPIVITLVQTTGAPEGYPNSDPQFQGTPFCLTNDPNIPTVGNLDWTIWPSGTADALGTGSGVSGDWLPGGNVGGVDVLDALAGIDINSGTLQVSVIDDIPGFGGEYFGYTIVINDPNTGCTLDEEVIFDPPFIIDDGGDNNVGEPTPPVECDEYENCTATYQWTGDDGFDSGVQTVANPSDMLETLPPTTVTPPPGTTTTYTLTVTDCFGCVSIEEVVITVGEALMATAEGGDCTLDITTLTGGVPDYTITIGMMPDASDAIATGTFTDATAMPEFMDLDPGDYYISITDASGCETLILGPITVTPCDVDPMCDDFMVDIYGCGMPIDSFIVDGNYPDGTIAPLPEVFVYCEGDLGCLDALATGGTEPYTYEWFELTDNCDYNDPSIGSGTNIDMLETGTYQVVVTDSLGCMATFEAKIFIDTDPTIDLNNGGDQEVTICQDEDFIIESTALQGPDFCKEYCGGELPQCPIDAASIITVCMEFDHTYISDLNFDLVAPDGTIIPLVTAQCCPNGADDAEQFCFTNDTSGGAVALDWNTTGSGGTDLLGLGTGISGNWLPTSGAGAFAGLVGVDANGGPWAMIVTDIVGGDSGTFNFFEVTITGGTCETVFTSPNFDAPIPDNQQAFTYETPVLECFSIENVISEYEWTCDDGTGTGVVPSTNNEIDDLTFTGAAPGTYICTLEVWDLWGCSSTSDFIVNVENCDSTDVFDLALIKELTSTGPFSPGDDVTFTITVTNQGTVDATSFELTDYIPAGMTLSPNDTNGWTGPATGPVTVMGGALPAGGTITIDIVLTIDPSFTGTELVNYAEISDDDNAEGLSDIDSTPDGDNTNDADGDPNSPADNTTGGDGTGTPGGGDPATDEDDHDPALIDVEQDSEECTITPEVDANIVCDDNGTPDDPSDDTFSFDVTVNGNNPVGTGIFDDDQGSSGVAYGTTVSYGPFPATGDITIIYTDVDDPTCTATITVSPPEGCGNGDNECMPPELVITPNCIGVDNEYEICISYDEEITGYFGSFNLYVQDTYIHTYYNLAYNDTLASGEVCFTIPQEDYIGDATDLETDISVCLTGAEIPACPQIYGILSNVCDSAYLDMDTVAVSEGHGEYVVIHNGPDPLDVSSIEVDAPAGDDYNDFNSITPPANWTCSCCQYLDESGTVPPGGIIIVTSELNDAYYDFDSLCPGDVYVIQDANTDPTEHFSNTGPNSTVLNLTGTASCDGATTYNSDSNDTEGEYTQFSTLDGTGTASAANSTNQDCFVQDIGLQGEVQCGPCGTYDEMLCLCPEVVVVDEVNTICTDGLATELTDWQTGVTDANPLDDVQDPYDWGTVHYSSTQDDMSGSWLPDGDVSGITGVHSGADICASEQQIVYAYIQCDRGTDDAADDTYTATGSFILDVYPSVEDAVTLVDDGGCCPSITVTCPDYVVDNSYDANGATPDCSAETATGNITFTITSTVDPSSGIDAACLTYEVTSAYECEDTGEGDCDLANVTIDFTDSTLCDPDGDGTITVSTTIQPTPVTFTLSNGDVVTDSGTFTDLPAGTYTIEISAGADCTLTTDPIIIGEPVECEDTGEGDCLLENVTIDFTDSTLCDPDGDGTITVSTTIQPTPVTFTLSNGDVVTDSGTFTDLPAGTYTIDISAGSDCSLTTDPITIGEPVECEDTSGDCDLANVTIDFTDSTLCDPDGDGTITVSTTIQPTPVTFTLSNGDVVTDAGTFTDLPAGTYTIDISAGPDCSLTTDPITIGEPVECEDTSGDCDLANVTIDFTDSTLCDPDGDGTITVSTTIQPTPVTFTLSNGDVVTDAGTFTDLPAGTYTIEISAGPDCSLTTDPITIGEPVECEDTSGECLAENVTIDFTDSTVCGSDGDGTITVSTTITPSPVTFILNGVDIIDAGTFTDLGAGDYIISVMGPDGCNIALDPVTIGEPAECDGALFDLALIKELNGSSPFAPGDDVTFTITVTNQGNVDATSFEVIDYIPAGLTLSASDTNGWVGSATGPVTYSGGALAANSSTTIDIVLTIDATFTGTLVNFAEISDDENGLGLDDNDSTPDSDNSNDAGGDPDSAADNTIDGDGTGTPGGSDEATDEDDHDPASIEVEDPNAACDVANVTVDYTDSTICAPSGDGTITVSTTIPSPVTFTLNGVDVIDAGTFTDLAAGDYTVTVSADGCDLTLDPITISESPLCEGAVFDLALIKELSSAGPFSPGDDVTFTITVTNQGTVDATSFEVTDYIPTGLTLSTNDSNGWSGSATGPVTTTGGALAAGSSTTIDIVLTIDASFIGTLVNYAEISAGDNALALLDVDSTPDGNDGNDSDGDPDSPADNTIGGDGTGTPGGGDPATDEDDHDPASIDVVNPDSVCDLANVTIDFTDSTLCGAEGDGTISVSTSIMPGPLTFTLDGVDIVGAGTFTDLAPGSYTVSISGPDGCDLTADPVTIAEPAICGDCNADAIDINSTDPTDCGEFDGTITITTTLTDAVEYSIDGGATFQSSGTFTTLSAGTYTIVVQTTNGGCVIDGGDTELADPASCDCSADNISIDSSNSTACAPGGDGSITITSSIAGNVAYSIDGGSTFQNNGSFTGLDGGTYTIVVQATDNDCVIDGGEVTLTDPASCACSADNITIDSSNSTACAPGSDGTITITTSIGGTVQYSIDGGASFQNSGSFTGLPAGSYTIAVQTSDGSCVIDGGSISLSDPDGCVCSADNVTIDSTDLTGCAPTVDGTITVSTSIGGTVEYSITGGAPFSSSGSFTGLAAGTYNIVVQTNDLSCVIDGGQVTIAEPASCPGADCNADNISIQSTESTLCSPNGDGTITIDASAIAGNAEYSIDGGTTFQSSGSFTGLAAGSYNIAVQTTDTNCSLDGGQVTIGQPGDCPSGPCDADAIQVESNDPFQCAPDSDGSITITPTISGTFEYSIDGGSTFQSSGTFEGLSPGTYTIAVQTPSGSCIIDGGSISLNELPECGNCDASSVDITVSDISSCGEDNGTILISPNGVSGTLLYSIDNGTTFQSSGIFKSLPAGDYIIIISNEEGFCTINGGTASITEPAGCDTCNANSVEISSTDATTCDAEDGTITITANIVGTVEYSIDGGDTFQSSNTFTGLPVGTYTIIVQNQEGTCSVEAGEEDVNKPFGCGSCNALAVEVNTSNVSSCNSSDGTISISASIGGTVEYSIDGGASYQSSNTFNGLGAGTYAIVVQNGLCTLNIDPATITEPEGCDACNAGSVDVVLSSAAVCGGSDGSITINASIFGTVEYSINGGATFQSSNTFNDLSAGSYDIVVQNTEGTCKVSVDPANLADPAGCGDCSADAINISATDITACDIDDDGSISISGSIGGSMEYSIDGGASYQSTNTFGGLAAGTYSVLVKNTSGVCLIEGGDVTIDSPAPTFGSEEAVDIKNCDDIPDGLIIVEAAGNVQYSIDGGNTWQSSGVFSSLSAGDYQVLVQYTDGTCTSEGSVLTVNAPEEFTGAPVSITCPSETVMNICAPVSPPPPLGLGDFGLSPCISSTDFEFAVEETTEVDGVAISYIQTYTIKDPAGNVTNCELVFNTTSEFIAAPELIQPEAICVGDLLSGIKIGEGTYNFYDDNDGEPGDLLSTCDYGGTICSTEGFTVNTNEPGSYTIWVTQFAGNSYGAACEGPAVPLTFEVMPLPEAELTTGGAEVCRGESLMLSDYVNSSNQTGFWSGPGVSSVMDGNGDTFYMFNGVGLGSQSPVKIYYTISNGMCEQSTLLTVDVDETPVEYWDSPGALCFGSANLNLSDYVSGGMSGEWLGDGVSSEGMFNAAYGPGTYTVSFIANDDEACNNVQTRDIVVNDVPDASFEMVSSVCADDDALDLMSLLTGDAGGYFSGDGVTGNMFNPGAVEGSEAAITYSVTSGGCTSEFTIMVTVTKVDPPVGAIPDQVVCSDATLISLAVESIYPFTYNWYSGDGSTVMGDGSEILIPAPGEEGSYTFLVEAVSPDGCVSEQLTEIFVEVIDCNTCAPIYSSDVNTNFACSGDEAEFTLTLTDVDANDQIVTLDTPNGEQVTMSSIGNGQYATSLILSNGFCAPEMETYTITAYCSDGTAIGQFTEDLIVYPNTIEPFINVSITEDGCTATATILPECEPYIMPIGNWTNTIAAGDKANSEFDYVYFSSTVNTIGCFQNTGTIIFGHTCTTAPPPPPPPPPPTCENEPGLMQTSQTYICDASAVNMAVAFSVVDDYSVTGYVLHEGEVFDPSTSTIITTSNTGQFSSPGAAYNNIPLYITAVIGHPGEDGFPILDDECTVWAPYGAYALFFDAINVSLVEETCTGDEYYVTVSVNGGVGVVAPHAAYLTVSDGSQTFTNISADEEVTFGPYTGSGQYEIEIVDVKGCRGGLVNSYSCGAGNAAFKTEISENLQSFNIEVYPNPTNGKFIVSCFDCTEAPISAQLYNANGQPVVTKVENDFELFRTEFDISKQPVGIYLVKVQFEDGSYQHFKVVKE